MGTGPQRPPGRAAPYPDSDRTASSGVVVSRLVVSRLVVVPSGALESVWATALGLLLGIVGRVIGFELTH